MKSRVQWHLKGKPYLAQTTALQRSELQEGFAFWLEMGLGKTGVLLNEIIDLCVRDRIDGGLIVCPNTIKKNWELEAKKFGFKGEVYLWPDVPKPSKMKSPFLAAINYEAVITKRGQDWMEEVLKSRKVMFGLDESSKIKNPSAKRTKALLMMSNWATYKRVLSGTPVTQNVGDLWAQLKFIGRMPLRFYPFRNRYCEMGGYMGRQIVGPNSERLPELLERMEDASFIAYKTDWTDLPPKIQLPPRQINLSPEQKKHYRRMEDEFFTIIAGSNIDVTLVLTQLSKLQQISCGFVHDEDGKAHRIPGPNPKMDEVLEIMDETGGAKSLVFAVHTESLAILLEGLKDYHPVLLTGKNSAKKLGYEEYDFDEHKKKFNEMKKHRVAVCQIQAGGIGHTLLGPPGDLCHEVIFFENTFSLEARKQAEDRPHRYGQEHAVSYHDFVGSPVELKAVMALQSKENISREVVKASRLT